MPDAAELRDWIGRAKATAQVIDAVPAARLHAVLDCEGAAPAAGDALPPGWHWLYFLEAAATRDLDADGHAKRGDFLPPVALPRRMWAGGRLEFHAPIRIGECIRRRSLVADITHKTGRGGALCFVTVRHEFFGGDALKLTEEHRIVYREAARADAPAATPLITPPGAPSHADSRVKIMPTKVLLFRYSALTFNAHRIHYDAEYCREAEGLRAPVVHGPLLATLLMDAATKHCGALRWFDYRAVSPLFVGEEFCVACAEDGGLQVWAENAGGGLAMMATAVFTPP